VNWENLANLVPILIAAVLFIGLTAWLVWPSKPPNDKENWKT
jgi:hypothetical protein